jgi:hypothetical protein
LSTRGRCEPAYGEAREEDMWLVLLPGPGCVLGFAVGVE